MINLTNLDLFIWLQSCEATDLVLARVDNAGADKVLRVRIDAIEDSEPKADQLQQSFQNFNDLQRNKRKPLQK